MPSRQGLNGIFTLAEFVGMTRIKIEHVQNRNGAARIIFAVLMTVPCPISPVLRPSERKPRNLFGTAFWHSDGTALRIYMAK